MTHYYLTGSMIISLGSFIIVETSSLCLDQFECLLYHPGCLSRRVAGIKVVLNQSAINHTICSFLYSVVTMAPSDTSYLLSMWHWETCSSLTKLKLGVSSTTCHCLLI